MGKYRNFGKILKQKNWKTLLVKIGPMFVVASLLYNVRKKNIKMHASDRDNIVVGGEVLSDGVSALEDCPISSVFFCFTAAA